MIGWTINALRLTAVDGDQTLAAPCGDSPRYNRVLSEEAAMRERAVPSTGPTPSGSISGLRVVTRALTFDDVLLIPAYSEI